MPVYRDVSVQRKEGKDEAYLKLYDGHDWKWFCVFKLHRYGISAQELVGEKRHQPWTPEKRHHKIFPAFFLYGRSDTYEDTGKRTDHL